jgi:hypothetical protein
MQLQSKYNLDELARLFGKAILRPEINKYKPLLNTGKNRGCGNTRGNRIGAMMFQVEHSYIKNVDVVNTYKAIISIYHNKAKINEITTLKETIKDNRVTSRKITAQLKKIYDNNTEEDNKNQQMLIDKLEKENELLIKKIEAQEADWNEKTKNIEVMQAYRALKILSKGGDGATKLCKKISKVIDGCDPSDTDKHMSGSGSDGFVNIHTSALQNTSLDNHLDGHLSSANTRNPKNHRQYSEDRPRRQNYQDYRDIVVTRGPSEKILAELREKHSKGEYIHASLMKFITEPDTNTNTNNNTVSRSQFESSNDTETDIALTDMKPLNNIITKTEVIGKWKTKPDFDLISKTKETKQIKEPIANTSKSINTRYYAKPQANEVKNDVKNKLKMPNNSIAELDVPRTVIYEDENGNQVEYFEDEMQENMFGEYDNFDEYDIEYNDEYNNEFNDENYDNGDDKVNASNIAGSDKSRDESEEAYSDANIYNEFEDNLDYEKYDNEPIDLDDFKV